MDAHDPLTRTNGRGAKVHSGVQIALGGLCLYLIYCGLLFLLQRSILFPGVRIDAPPGVVPSGLEVIWLDVAGGKVEAWYLPPAPGADPAPAMIFAHGNAELIDFWPEGLRAFTGLGLGVLLVEYPGYGRSKGVPSQKRIAEAFVAAYDTLVARQDVDGRCDARLLELRGRFGSCCRTDTHDCQRPW